MDNNFVQIKDMRPGMKNINVLFIVLEVGLPTVTKENREVRTLKVADQSACINASIWDEPGQLLMPGDIVRLTKGSVNFWRNCLTLYSSKGGDLQKVGEFCMVFNEHLNMSEPNSVMPMTSLGGGPPNNAPMLNNGTNNGAGRMNAAPQAGQQQQQQHQPQTTVLNNSTGIVKQAQGTQNRIGGNGPPPSSQSSSNNDSQKARIRGSRGGQHRNRHNRS